MADETDDVYEHEGREHLVKDDEITPEEEAFMEGFDEELEESEEGDDTAYEAAFED
jgi:hypothetical protein